MRITSPSYSFCILIQILIRTRFVGEESYSKGASRDYLIDDSPTWCVDPLDGKSSPLREYHQL
ncbi:MAG: hypothetical protein EOO38_11575 [Cytophagaceae bacterium]|nr:MAG: hypothetical protein EOO38_11575 [Cytophagaceae bacterium]